MKVLTTIIVLTVVIAAAVYWRWRRVIARSRHWPSVAGTITRSKLKEHDVGDGGTRYSHDLGYAYQVEGQSYEGDRQRWFGVETRERPNELDWALRQNPVGKEV